MSYVDTAGWRVPPAPINARAVAIACLVYRASGERAGRTLRHEAVTNKRVIIKVGVLRRRTVEMLNTKVEAVCREAVRATRPHPRLRQHRGDRHRRHQRAVQRHQLAARVPARCQAQRGIRPGPIWAPRPAHGQLVRAAAQDHASQRRDIAEVAAPGERHVVLIYGSTLLVGSKPSQPNGGANTATQACEASAPRSRGATPSR
jgi:hypothetical protein